MLGDVFFGDGMSLIQTLDGREFRVPWRSAMFETREKLYEARLYADGRQGFFVNCRPVEKLPNTAGTKLVLAEFAKMLEKAQILAVE